MIDQQRREQHTQVDQREAERLACQRVRIVAPQRECIAGKTDTDAHGDRQIQPAAHAVDERHQTGGKKDKSVEQPSSRNKGSSSEDIAQFIESVIVYAKQYVDGIATGRFPLVKESRRTKSCAYCEFNPICRVDQAVIDGVLPE